MRTRACTATSSSQNSQNGAQALAIQPACLRNSPDTTGLPSLHRPDLIEQQLPPLGTTSLAYTRVRLHQPLSRLCDTHILSPTSSCHPPQTPKPSCIPASQPIRRTHGVNLTTLPASSFPRPAHIIDMSGPTFYEPVWPDNGHTGTVRYHEPPLPPVYYHADGFATLVKPEPVSQEKLSLPVPPVKMEPVPAPVSSFQQPQPTICNDARQGFGYHSSPARPNTGPRQYMPPRPPHFLPQQNVDSPPLPRMHYGPMYGQVPVHTPHSSSQDYSAPMPISAHIPERNPHHHSNELATPAPIDRSGPRTVIPYGLTAAMPVATGFDTSVQPTKLLNSNPRCWRPPRSSSVGQG